MQSNESVSEEIRVTPEQRATPHPFEDAFTRRMAWTFENVFRDFGRRATSEEEFNYLIHNFGQININSGRSAAARAWAEFVARKFLSALTTEPAASDELEVP